MHNLSKQKQALLVLAFALTPALTYAQTPGGTLDASFGTAGKVTTDFFLLDQGFSVAQASALAVLPDDRLVVGGRACTNGGFHAALAGYNGDGTLDANFGTGGKVSTNFGGDDEEVRSVARQPDGKIVTAEGAALARYN